MNLFVILIIYILSTLSSGLEVDIDAWSML